MHIIIGFLTALVTIFYLLDQLGINVGGLNPFYLYRRYAFAKKYGADPIFSVEDPMHIASLIVIGGAKLGGDLTAEQKQVAQSLFEKEFSLDNKEASQLFGSAAHLLAAPALLQSQLEKLVGRNKTTFSAEQADSLVAMVEKVANADGAGTDEQRAFVALLHKELAPKREPEGTWS